MVRNRSFVALVLASLCLLSPLASAAPATSDTHAAIATPSGHATSETWVGALAAIGCGLSIKVTILTGGTVVATIAAAVSTCALMILDGLLDPK